MDYINKIAHLDTLVLPIELFYSKEKLNVGSFTIFERKISGN